MAEEIINTKMPQSGVYVLLALVVAVGGGSTPGDRNGAWDRLAEAEARLNTIRARLAQPEIRESIYHRWNHLPDLTANATMRAPLPACAQHFSSAAALSMIDASAKDAPGLLRGSWTHFGNWDECVGIRDVEAPGGETFHGQMCMVKLGFVPLGRNIDHEVERNLERLVRDEGLLAGRMGMVTSISLKMGACVPSTCSPEDVEVLFESLFGDILSNVDMGLKVVVDPLECTTQEKPGLDASDWVAVAIFIVLGLAVVLSTALDILIPTRRPLLAAFSVYTNGKKLLTVSSGGDGTISCLHGLRLVSMCWVVLCHRYMVAVQTPLINLLHVLDLKDSIWRIGITNGTLSVDTFFAISGLLLSYLFFKQMRVNRRFNIIMFYVHRYIRLTPALAFMVLFNATLLYHVGWGPIWASGMSTQRESCREHWWDTLLYVNNYVSPLDSCVGQGWYLMVDMQLYWLSPILLFTVLLKPRLGALFVALLFAGGFASAFTVTYVNDLPANFITVQGAENAINYMKLYYVNTYTRFVPYLIGICLGYILADLHVKGQKIRLSMVTALLLWLTAAALLLVPLFVGYKFIKEPLPPVIAAAFYNALNRCIWAAGVCLVVFLCATGHGGPINTLLSWNGFQLLGRLSYSVFLVHGAVQSSQTYSARTNSYLSDMVVLPGFAGDLFLSFLLAAALSLVTESPFLVIEKELLGRGSPGRTEGGQTATNEVPASQLSPSAALSDNSAPAALKRISPEDKV